MADSKEIPEYSKKMLAEARSMANSWGNTLEREPEWFVIYGKTRCGKSYQMHDMFEFSHIRALNANANDPKVYIPQYYVLNLDRSGSRDIENFPLLEASGVVHHRFCQDIYAVMASTLALVGDPKNNIPRMVKPGDFIAVDRATVVWEGMANYYCETRLGKSADQIEFEYQTSASEGKVKKGSGLLEFYARGINPLWHHWVSSILLSGAHVVFICTEQELALEKTPVRDKDDQEKIAAFQQVGYVPKMQGDTWARFHTQLYMSRPYSKPQWFVRTVGDRGNRRWLGTESRQEVGTGDKGLGQLYLGEVAGWQ